MGIQGLIPFLQKGSTRINISQYNGCCVAVDAYCWLHKGAYTCAEKLARGEECDAYVFYCMKFINMLLSHNIKPILVFDGRHLPAKGITEKKRRESRESNRKAAADLLDAGRVGEARNYLRRCVDVTHKMALALIKECRKNNVDCIVAPYEADAQLAYLNLQNIAQIVITEDSDLVLFGCSKVVFKLDLQGYGLLIERERLHLSMGLRAEDFNFDNFRYMCILSGCDYLASLPGIGLNKALKFIKKTKDPDICRALQRIPAYLNMTNLRVSDEYQNAFLTAVATFRYQPVFDTRSRSIVPLTEPPEGEEVPCIVDEDLPPDVAFNLALGNLDPFTLEQMDNFDPDCPQGGIASIQRRVWGSSPAMKHPSIWSRDYAGFQSVRTEKIFPSNRNKCAILDVTPLQIRKRPATQETANDYSTPSDVDLESMYGNKDPVLPAPKRQCSSEGADLPEENPSEESSVQVQSSSPIASAENVQQPPPSPIVSQKKSCNPFAKPNCVQISDTGPVGAMGRPNFFSALRKFDGIYPMKIDSDVIVSRSEKIDENSSGGPRKSTSDIVNDTSEHPSTKQKTDGYTCDKEKVSESNIYHPETTLPQLELAEIKDSQITNSCTDEDEKLLEVTPVKSASSSFNWSQFSCRKSLSNSKMINSPAVRQTFKNPLKKESAEVSVSLDKFLEVNKAIPLGAVVADEEQPQLSGESTDSGYIGSQAIKEETCKKLEAGASDSPEKHTNSSSCGSASIQRRLGMGCSTPLQSNKKQNLLAKYGFSKKKKIVL